MEKLYLVDIWREKNPDKKLFTWMNTKEGSWSRIDFFLISESLRNKCIEARIDPSICTDHSCISIKVEISDSRRGPGVWKFNNKLLQDSNFDIEMNNMLKGAKRLYGHLNSIDYWEVLKFEIASFSREYSKGKAWKDKDNKFKLYKSLESLQEEMCKREKPSEELLTNIEHVKIELDSCANMDARRAAFRCHQQWIDSGERMSKYFFNLEKRNAVSKTMYIARKKDGTLTKDYTEILNLQKDFFQDLFTSDPRVNFNIRNNSKVKLTQIMKEKFDSEVTVDELFDAMMTLKRGKTPGGDGLTVELYKQFWHHLKLPLHEMYCQAVDEGQLNPTGRHGIINLIPKKNHDNLEVKNWRGISILNYDYKIWSKVIANRLEEVTDMIGKDQTGFIKGRSLFTNIRKTMEVISHLNGTNSPGIVVIIDFEKCFDRIEFQSIKGVFEFFGFGHAFIKKLFLLFTGLKFRTQSGGFTSQFFRKYRGVNQGCCASPLIYSFCSAIIQHIIYANDAIQGIDLNGIKTLLSQFADDTAAFLKYDRIVLEEFTKELGRVEALMGLKISYEKTTIYRIGSLRHTDAVLYTQKSFTWSNGPVETLGVKIDTDGGSSIENFSDVMTKLKKVCNCWINRQLTIFGKILVVNTLMGSLFVYKMTTMLNLESYQIGQINEVIRNFIWNHKKSKIAFATLQKEKLQGGARLVNIEAKQDALKIGWIFKLDMYPFLAECAYTALNPLLRNWIWRCNINKKDAVQFKPGFWRVTLVAWSKINAFSPERKEDVIHEILWSNSNIKIRGKLVTWKKWFDKNIMFIEDIWNECTLEFKSAEELEVSWLDLRSLIHAIPDHWKEILKGTLEGAPCSRKQDIFNVLARSANVTRQAYNVLIYDEHAVYRYYVRWVDRGFIELEYNDYIQYFARLYASTKITKFRDFQYRLLLGKIILNVELFEWRITDSNLCSFCHLAPETLEHVFWECNVTQILISLFRDICTRNDIEINLNKYTWIFNCMIPNRYHIINFINIIFKQYIYKSKCTGKIPNPKGICKVIEYLFLSEVANAKRTNREKKVYKKWGPVLKTEN